MAKVCRILAGRAPLPPRDDRDVQAWLHAALGARHAEVMREELPADLRAILERLRD